MICPICQQEHCDCDMRIGLAAAVLGTGDPSEAVALHKQYGKEPNYQYIITAARKLAYEGEEAVKQYLVGYRLYEAIPDCSPCPLTGHNEIPNGEPRCDDCPAAEDPADPRNCPFIEKPHPVACEPRCCNCVA